MVEPPGARPVAPVRLGYPPADRPANLSPSVAGAYSSRMPLFGNPGERIAYALYPSLQEPDGPPLVLLHGFTTSSAAFDANVEALRRHFTVVTVDLLGHGASESPVDAAPYGPEHAVERLLALFDELGLGRVLLCGHSLGGALALRLALDAPERLSGLVVMNSMSAAGTPQWRENARAGMGEMARRARAEGTEFLKETRLYPAHSKRLDERSRQLLVDAFEQLTPEGMAGNGRGAHCERERLGTPSGAEGAAPCDRRRSRPRFRRQRPRLRLSLPGGPGEDRGAPSGGPRRQH